jgi:hypothetical protein
MHACSNDDQKHEEHEEQQQQPTPPLMQQQMADIVARIQVALWRQQLQQHLTRTCSVFMQQTTEKLQEARLSTEEARKERYRARMLKHRAKNKVCPSLEPNPSFYPFNPSPLPPYHI